MPQASFSLVTVVFGAELPLLELQARSVARFCGDLPVTDILLIVNEKDPADTVARLRAMIPAWGPFAPAVRIATGDDLFTWDNTDRSPWHGLRCLMTRHPALRLRFGGAGWGGHDGWQMQQAMKLASARAGAGAYTVLLDAKNVLLHPVLPGDLVAEDGRPRARFAPPGKLHRDWQRASARHVGGSPAPAPAQAALRFVTPFVIRRALLKDVLDHVEARSGPVQSLFSRRRNKATEFMLVDAYCKLAHGGLDPVFAEGLMRSYTVFKGMAPDLGERILREAQDRDARCLGLHRGALAAFSETHWTLLEGLLTRAGLFADAAAVAAWRRGLEAP